MILKPKGRELNGGMDSMAGSEDQFKFTPVAIIGVGALFPGSNGPKDFWKNIQNGIDLVSDIPAGHWLVEDYYDPDPAKPGKTYARRGAFISPVDFDPLEFGIPPNNLPVTDTAQLLGLVVARWALKDAFGPSLEGLDRRRTSVILGVASATELVATMSGSLQRPIWVKALREAGLPEGEVQSICDRAEKSYVAWTENTFPGLLGNVVAGRIANRFDLGGTNCVIDAACASSLAAVHMAVQELTLRTADVVLTGGVDALNDILMFMCFSKTSAISPTGDCRPFSIDADGTLLGEGVGLLALRRLEDAERDGNKIYAVIRGLGSSSDGRAKSIYAPRAEGQLLALRRTYAAAGYSPNTVELMEAHGTGTKAGDLAEISALRTIFEESDGTRPWCALGSVKSQVGHTKAAAGTASLYKVAMALHHKVLPPTIKISAPNPRLGIDDSAFYLNTKLRPWISNASRPRRASISSFGFGGSNFHVTLEEYRGPNHHSRIRNFPAELFLFDAPSAAALKTRIHAVIADLEKKGFQAAARGSQLGFRFDAPVRLAAIGAGPDEIIALLKECAARIERQPDFDFSHPGGAFYARGPIKPGRIAFLFPGQGSQYLNMGADIAIAFEHARRVWDDAATDPAGPLGDTSRYVYPHPPFTAERMAAQVEKLTATEIAQPAIGLTSLMHLAVLKHIGLSPDAVVGHSFGEVTALFCAGVFDVADFLAVARQRGALMAAAGHDTKGAMLAVFSTKEQVDAALQDLNRPDIVIANENAPEQFVLAGPVAAIEAAVRFLSERKINHRRLPVATAFHSPIVSSAREPFATFLGSVAVAPPRVPVYANSTAALYPSEPDLIRSHLAAQLTKPVYFSRQIDALYNAGIRIFLEVGPGTILSDLTSACLAGRPHTAAAMDRKGRNGITQLFTALGQIAIEGFNLNFASLWDGFAIEENSQAVPSVCNVKITGANFGKAYPPADGVAGVPKPSKVAASVVMNTQPALRAAPAQTRPGKSAAPSVAPVPASCSTGTRPEHSIPAPIASPAEAIRFPSNSAPDGSHWHNLVLALHQQSARAHETSQKAMVDAHMAFLQTSQTALRSLEELATGRNPRPLPTAEMSPAGQIPPTSLPIAAPDVITSTSKPDRLSISKPVQSADVKRDAAPTLAPSAPLVSPSPVARDLGALMLKIVADKTGYPVEMLNPDMELETDLGIDSIKRVEILAALHEAAPDLPDVDTRELAGLRTLRSILARLGDSAVGTAFAAPPVAARPVAAPLIAAPLAAIPARDLGALMLKIVADKTGYPVEMLNPDMELETDLGIDSIKRVEILAALREVAPDLPDVDARELAGLSTLRSILARLGDIAESGPALIAKPSINRLSREEGPAPLSRFGLATAETPPTGCGMADLIAGRIVDIVGKSGDLAEALVAALTQRGMKARTSDTTNGSDAAILLTGLDWQDPGDSLGAHLDVFRAARSFAAAGGKNRSFVTLQDTGGDFGLSGRCRGNAWMSGFSGLVKTAAKEWPSVGVKSIDIERAARSNETVVEAIVAELTAGGPELEVGLPADGRRLTLIETELDAALNETTWSQPRPVIVVSGGARGILPACLLELTKTCQPRLALIGRTKLAEEASATMNVDDAGVIAALHRAFTADGRTLSPLQVSGLAQDIINGREIRRTLTELERAGAEPLYLTADVADASQMSEALAQIRTKWGAIDGVIHGAGVLADKLIIQKTDEEFAKVFRTKVDGLRSLLQATEQDDLKSIILFSSVAARYGNVGQCDYAAANEVLNKVARAEALRRGPSCRVKSLNWAPWESGMVTENLRKLFLERGISPISKRSGAQAFVAEMMAGEHDRDIDVVIGHRNRVAGPVTGEKRQSIWQTDVIDT